MPPNESNDWNERFSKASKIVGQYNNSGQPSRFQTVEIEFGDDSAPEQQKSTLIQKLYDYDTVKPHAQTQPQPSQPETPERKNKSYSYDLDGGVMMTCKIEDWSKGFALFGDFLRDAKKYYRKTCINANYVYFFSYRPMYRELSHEQLCWYLFWRSRIREGTYPKTGLSYIFLYIYEQINLSDIIGHEKVYANIIRVWKNYRAEFPRIDKYIAEWLIDFAFIYKIKLDLNDIEEILPDIINIVTIPEVYLRDDFFRNKNNIDLIITNLSVYDYKKSKFYNEKTKELFDYHVTQILHAVLPSADFEAIIKKEIDDGVKIRTTRESFTGAVCLYEHKKRITVEYKNLYKNFFIRQCITDTVRYAENVLRDYLNIKSKLTVTAYPEQLKTIIEEYGSKYLTVIKTPKITVKTKGKKGDVGDDAHVVPEPIEFNPNIQTAAEIEKSSWDTTMTLVELQERDNIYNAEIVSIEEVAGKFEEIYEDDEIEIYDDDDGEFIAIDTGNPENYAEVEAIAPLVETGDHAGSPLQNMNEIDIFDVLESLESPDDRRGDPAWSPAASTTQTDMGKFVASLNEEEHAALEMLLNAKTDGKSFDMLCGEYLSRRGGMLESVVDALNEKAMDFTGDIVFDTASQEIVEDYREEMEEWL